MSKPSPLILIVDDSEDARDILAGTLEFSGYQVAVAHDGEEAIRKAQVLRPSAVLLDLFMPNLDGFEAARRLRENTFTITEDHPGKEK